MWFSSSTRETAPGCAEPLTNERRKRELIRPGRVTEPPFRFVAEQLSGDVQSSTFRKLAE
jgi:hypothetical protein